MQLQKTIAIIFTGLFLLNLSLSHSGSLLKVLMGKEVTVVHPFCKNAKNKTTETSAFKVDKSVSNSFEISAICTTVFNFNTTNFTFIAATDNFKEYLFKDSLLINLFADQFYIPPRV